MNLDLERKVTKFSRITPDYGRIVRQILNSYSCVQTEEIFITVHSI